jgi:phospholipase C
MLLFWGLLVCTAGFLISLNGCGGGSQNLAAPPPTLSKIQHVVVIFQENRSTDNLFHDPKLIAEGADIASTGLNSQGLTVPLMAVPMTAAFNPDHSHSAFLDMYDGGKMDGADKIVLRCPGGTTNCVPAGSNFAYVDPADVAPYFQLAETYTFADQMFQTNQGPSFPAHQFLISGTSAPTANSNLFVAENPGEISSGNSETDTGCTAPAEETVRLITPDGDESQKIYPCFEHATLTDELNAKAISWRYYAPSAGSIWTAPNAIQHMCGPNAPIPNATACAGADWTNNVVLHSQQVLMDVQNGQLATVSWVIPSGQASDHPLTTDGSGPSWVASIVNAIGNSPYWANTAIVITWDDWGGWYDHVKPPAVLNSYEYGFRVPMIVVSPFAKPAFVSHTFYDFGSILKFIERNFGLSAIAPGYADTLNTGDLSDCFDFNQMPLTFQPIPTRLDANHFLKDKTPPMDPDDD